MAGSEGAEALPVILERLNKAYPGARYELNGETPLQLLVATILAAQCSDERVNQVTPALFARYPDAKAYAEADLAELGEAIKPTGFYVKKAKRVQDVCRDLVARFGGEVPASMEQLLTLPGVARKTANLLLTHAFRAPAGISVDTHVTRVSRRLGLSAQKRPEKIERDLLRLVPREEWATFGPALVLHGRRVCTFRKPRCAECALNDVCPKVGVGEEEGDEGAEDVSAEAPPATMLDGGGPGPERGARAMQIQLPADWRKVLAGEMEKPYFQALEKFVDGERKAHQVFPPEGDVFNAFKATPYEKVKVLLLGQDPYHDDGQAHGMCFSVRPGVRPPPSLMNMFKELHSELGCKIPDNGYLEPWAKQGVMLLNAVLTVRAHQPNSHKDRGWETFTDAVIRALNARERPVVFALWGAYAQKKKKLIDAERNPVVTAAHPSPLSAKKFFGSKPFSAINDALEGLGEEPIDCQVPDLGVKAKR